MTKKRAMSFARAAAVAAALVSVQLQDAVAAVSYLTTSPRIAIANLDAQIEGLQRRAASESDCPKNASVEIELIERLTFRARIRSRFADSREALQRSRVLVRCLPNDQRASLSHAAVLVHFHRFDEALAIADRLVEDGTAPQRVRNLRAQALHGLGRFGEGLALRREEVARHATPRSLGGLAVLLGDMGRVDEAEELFARAIGEYRDVSPIPLAWLEHSRGRMWMRLDQADRAAAAFQRSRDLLPDLLASSGLLAEIRFEQGNAGYAIGELRRLATLSDDPDYAAHLSRMLLAEGRVEEGERWRTVAADGFVALMLEAPEMYADHAAEFWLAAGADPRRAMHAAAVNLAARRTPGAIELFGNALRADEGAPEVCGGALASATALAACRDALEPSLAKASPRAAFE